MRSAAVLLTGFLLLVLQSAVATLVPLQPFSPNLVLPLVIYLGVAHDVHIVRGAVLAFVLGYALDAFCGSPIGLQTFVLVATFLVARSAGMRLFLRGPLFQVLLAFVASLLAFGVILALQAIFEKRPPFPAGSAVSTSMMLLGPAFTTALTAPFVFALVRRVESWVTRRRDERGVVAA